MTGCIRCHGPVPDGSDDGFCSGKCEQRTKRPPTGRGAYTPTHIQQIRSAGVEAAVEKQVEADGEARIDL